MLYDPVRGEIGSTKHYMENDLGKSVEDASGGGPSKDQVELLETGSKPLEVLKVSVRASDTYMLVRVAPVAFADFCASPCAV